MKSTKALLGARIKELRKKKHLSQEQLAEKMNVQRNSLSRFEVGEMYPSIETLEVMAKALDVEIKDLFEFSHLNTTKVVKDQIADLLTNATEDDLRKFLMLLRALVR